MGTRLKVPFIARVKGGGVFTFVGTAAGQAVYWYLDAIDPRPGMGPWPAVGRLQRPRYRIGRVRYGTRFRYGIAVPYGEIASRQLRVLALLQCRCRLPSELARELRVTPATASETVDLLVRRGFITRGDEPLDRRQTPLSITEAG